MCLFNALRLLGCSQQDVAQYIGCSRMSETSSSLASLEGVCPGQSTRSGPQSPTLKISGLLVNLNDIYFTLLSLLLALLSALVSRLGLSIYNTMRLRIKRFLSNGRRGWIKVKFRVFLSD